MCCAWRVNRSADSLPDDIDALRALALNAIAERDAAIAERDRLIELNDRLRHLLRKAQGFEAKSERLAKLHPDQLNLALEDLEQAIAKTEAIEEKNADRRCRARKRRINRGALPAHLPRIHETVAPADTNCPCCKQPMHVIGEETSERLDVIPAQYRVIVTHRPEARLPGLREDRGSAGAGASDQIRPADRSHGRLRAGGQIRLAPAALSPGQDAGLPRASTSTARRWPFWVGYAAAELMPLYERLKANLLGLRQTRRRRDAGAGARSRARPDQDRLLLGDRAR